MLCGARQHGAGSDALRIARDIKPALERVKYAMNNNYGLALWRSLKSF